MSIELETVCSKPKVKIIQIESNKRNEDTVLQSEKTNQNFATIINQIHVRRAGSWDSYICPYIRFMFVSLHYVTKPKNDRRLKFGTHITRDQI